MSHPLIIYTPQNGEFLRTILDAMVALLGTSSFRSLLDIMLVLAAFMMGYQFIVGKKLESVMRFMVTAFFVLFGLIGIRVDVAIVDMQEPQKGLTVDNVPLGNALPAALISEMGYGVTQLFSDVFHMPDDLDYNKTGMIFGARTWLSSTSAKYSQSPDLAYDLSAYIRQCIFAAKLLASHQISAEQLVHEPHLESLYFKEPSPIYRLITHDGQNLSCGEAATVLKAQLPKAANKELASLSMKMTAGNTNQFSTTLEAAHQYYMNISESSAAILTQNMFINATRDAAFDAFAFSGSDAGLMNFTNTSSMQKMRVAEANSFWLASYRLPYFMTVFWLLTICIFPLIVLFSLFPTMENIYKLYIQSQVYLWSWPPMFVIIHFFVSMAAAKTMNVFGVKSGGITFSNIDALAALQSDFAYTAGALAPSVIFLAYYLTKGLSSVLNNASQHFGGLAQSLSVSEAQSATQGNVAMATYNGWNMNYDNTNAHKSDTNYTDFSGMRTEQMVNGATLSETLTGSRAVNSQPAMSQMAISLHGSDRVSDSLHQGMTESFNQASQLRTASDEHYQAGLNQLTSFSNTDSNEYRSGEGVSKTTTDSINNDFREMHDAVQQYNEHHDVSRQIGFEAAVTGKVSTDKSLVGKGVKWITGMLGEGSVALRGGGSLSQHDQHFLNSSEGQSFSDAYNHMVSTAQHHHLDASDSKNLSQSEQIAAHFAAGHSLSKQASSEYSHGEQLQEAASHVRDHASSVESNLSQAYHDWVYQQYGSRGEQVLLQTDAPSIAVQNQWADAFYQSQSGQNAIGAEVKNAVSSAKVQLKSAPMTENALLNKQPLVTQYYDYTQRVNNEKTSQRLEPMDAAQFNAAQSNWVHNRTVNLKEEVERAHQNVKLNTEVGQFLITEQKPKS